MIIKERWERILVVVLEEEVVVVVELMVVNDRSVERMSDGICGMADILVALVLLLVLPLPLLTTTVSEPCLIRVPLLFVWGAVSNPGG